MAELPPRIAAERRAAEEEAARLRRQVEEVREAKQQAVRRPTMAERLEALLPADGLRELVTRLEQLRAQQRQVDEGVTYHTDDNGVVQELRVVRSFPRRG